MEVSTSTRILYNLHFTYSRIRNGGWEDEWGGGVLAEVETTWKLEEQEVGFVPTPRGGGGGGDERCMGGAEETRDLGGCGRVKGCAVARDGKSLMGGGGTGQNMRGGGKGQNSGGTVQNMGGRRDGTEWGGGDGTEYGGEGRNGTEYGGGGRYETE